MWKDEFMAACSFRKEGDGRQVEGEDKPLKYGLLFLVLRIEFFKANYETQFTKYSIAEVLSRPRRQEADVKF